MSGQQHALAILYPRERPGTHCTGGWVGPRAGMDRWKILPPGIRSPDCSAHSQLLYWLSYPAHMSLHNMLVLSLWKFIWLLCSNCWSEGTSLSCINSCCVELMSVCEWDQELFCLMYGFINRTLNFSVLVAFGGKLKILTHVRVLRFITSEIVL